MANIENLKPLDTLCKEDAKVIQSMGGIARAESIAKRKTLKETLLMMLAENDMQGNITLALLNKALKGDTKAFEVVRDTVGEKPIEQKEVKSDGTLNIIMDNDIKELAE